MLGGILEGWDCGMGEGDPSRGHICIHLADLGFPDGSVVKNPPATEGDVGDEGLIPGLEKSPGAGNGNPLQYSCLENPMEEDSGGLPSMGS